MAAARAARAADKRIVAASTLQTELATDTGEAHATAGSQPMPGAPLAAIRRLTSRRLFWCSRTGHCGCCRCSGRRGPSRATSRAEMQSVLLSRRMSQAPCPFDRFALFLDTQGHWRALLAFGSESASEDGARKQVRRAADPSSQPPASRRRIGARWPDEGSAPEMAYSDANRSHAKGRA